MQCQCKRGVESNWDFKCGRCRTKADGLVLRLMHTHAVVAPGKVTVVNKHSHVPTSDDVYIGRGSPLGNPNAITTTVSRKTVCAMYVSYIMQRLTSGDKRVITALDAIANTSLEGKPVNLVCYCSPQQCHGDYIKKLVDDAVRQELKLNPQPK